MEIKLTRLNDAFAFQAENEEGQSIHIDSNPAIGGKGLGMRPMEILASSLASCASIDVLLILKKKRVKLESYEVNVSASRKFSVPAVFESIHLTFRIGENDSRKAVEKAAKLSVEKYCSVAAMLIADCQITYEVLASVPSLILK